MRRTRMNPAAGFKAKVTLAALKGDKTLAELAQEFDVHANQIMEWKQQMLDRAAEVFDRGSVSKQPPYRTSKCCTPDWSLTLQNDFLEGALTKAGMLSVRR